MYPKMVQLSLELLARYSRTIAKFAGEGAGGGASETGAASAVASAWDATAGVWRPSSLIARLARAGADVQEVIKAIHCGEEASPSDGASARLVVERAPGGVGGHPASLARALLREAAKELQSIIGLLGDAGRKQVTAAVVPQFGAIRGIPAFYRMLNKPLPTKASPYVESALKPIRALHDVASQNALPEADCKDWVRKAADDAGVEFAAQASSASCAERADTPWTKRQRSSWSPRGSRRLHCGGWAGALVPVARCQTWIKLTSSFAWTSTLSLKSLQVLAPAAPSQAWQNSPRLSSQYGRPTSCISPSADAVTGGVWWSGCGLSFRRRRDRHRLPFWQRRLQYPLLWGVVTFVGY